MRSVQKISSKFNKCLLEVRYGSLFLQGPFLLEKAMNFKRTGIVINTPGKKIIARWDDYYYFQDWLESLYLENKKNDKFDCIVLDYEDLLDLTNSVMCATSSAEPGSDEFFEDEPTELTDGTERNECLDFITKAIAAIAAGHSVVYTNC